MNEPARDAPKRVLLIDDDVELCQLVVEFLSARGYAVQIAHDGVLGLEAALSTMPDVVVLDVMMPGLDGFEVLTGLRRHSRVPVIMLTARGEPEDRIRGLEAGADDYLPKPFVGGELLARMRAVLRRIRPDIGNVLAVGPLRLDRTSRRLYHGANELPTTATEFDVLELLACTVGTTVPRDAMARTLYGRNTTAYERALDVHVSHLRKKLSAVPKIAIRTDRGVGYRLITEP